MKSYIYLLHFPGIGNAQHYAGCTGQIRRRLAAHAAGRGSALTRELHRRGVPWELAAVWLVADKRKYQCERHLKDSHNLARYCPICTGGVWCNPIAATPIDPSNVNFDRSRLVEGASDLEVRLTVAGEPPETSEWIKRLMRSDKNALGFIPAGGPEGLTYLVERGKIAVVTLGGEPAGYCAFTVSNPNRTIKIQQVCVDDAYRLCGAGSKLVEFVRDVEPEFLTQCNVADDLPANFFWRSIGAQLQWDYLHSTSKRRLNHYEFPRVEEVYE